jgi:hypothetical protein
MDNEDTYNEENATTQRLLEAICNGVILPTEKEEEEALENQHN